MWNMPANFFSNVPTDARPNSAFSPFAFPLGRIKARGRGAGGGGERGVQTQSAGPRAQNSRGHHHLMACQQLFGLALFTVGL